MICQHTADGQVKEHALQSCKAEASLDLLDLFKCIVTGAPVGIECLDFSIVFGDDQLNKDFSLWGQQQALQFFWVF